MTLAGTVAVVSGEVEGAVILPGASDFTWGKQVDILVIQEDSPTSDSRFFVAKATFDLTRLRELPSAGIGPPNEGTDSSFWSIALLTAAGALLALAGLRLRASAA